MTKISKDLVKRLRNKLGNISAMNDMAIDKGMYDEDDANALEEVNILLVQLLRGETLEVSDEIPDEIVRYYEYDDCEDYNEEE